MNEKTFTRSHHIIRKYTKNVSLFTKKI